MGLNICLGNPVSLIWGQMGEITAISPAKNRHGNWVQNSWQAKEPRRDRGWTEAEERPVTGSLSSQFTVSGDLKYNSKFWSSSTRE